MHNERGLGINVVGNKGKIETNGQHWWTVSETRFKVSFGELKLQIAFVWNVWNRLTGGTSKLMAAIFEPISNTIFIKLLETVEK